PLVDREGRVIAVLGGRPNDPEYLRLTEEAANHLESACGNPALHLDRHIGRRGTFTGVSAGVSLGGGQQVRNLTLTAVLQRVMRDLFVLQYFMRIAGFANGLFRTWNSVVHALYAETLDALVARNSGLVCNFPREVSVFAAATLNFSPATVTFPHTDALNLAWGWCIRTTLLVGWLVSYDLVFYLQLALNP
ncbi:hypothetical protein B0H14DRAFT_2360675, partial [Mycena olivaceomarginata]